MAPTFTFADLKPFEDRRVIIHTTEGEILRARIAIVSPHAQDMIYDLIETNQPSRYTGNPPASAYSLPFEYVAGIRLEDCEEPDSCTTVKPI